LERCDVLLLCVADRGLVESVAALAAAGPAPHARAVVLHTAGSRGAELLAPLARRGWSCGALHPLVPLPARDLAAARARLTGASYALEGEARALRVARELVRSLEGSVLRLQGGRRTRARYHAAAALASGGLVALWDLSLGELEAAGLERKQARRALHGLLAANLEHLERLEPERALTGPVARGDVELVGEHLGALSAPAREAYRVLGRRMLALAKAGGALPRGSLAQLGRLLED